MKTLFLLNILSQKWQNEEVNVMWGWSFRECHGRIEKFSWPVLVYDVYDGKADALKLVRNASRRKETAV